MVGSKGADWKVVVGEASCRFVSEGEEDDEVAEELDDDLFPARVPHRDMVSR